MSAFSDVDRADDPRRLIQYLDDSARALGAMKQYAAAAHALRDPSDAVLDLGCGVGLDLQLLARVGVRGIGIDPSALMLRDATTRTRMPLVRGAGERLPFRDGAFAGCRVERVLMHVVDPATVIAEVVRCVRSGGLITIFEPDWSCLEVAGERVPTDWTSGARHPAIGSTVGDLLTDAGCIVRDRVEERSWWSYEDFTRIMNLEAALDRAVAANKLTRAAADAWLEAQRRSADRGTFRAEMVKILWVATAPGG